MKEYMHKCILTHEDYDHMGESINFINKIKLKYSIIFAGKNNKLKFETSSL